MLDQQSPKTKSITSDQVGTDQRRQGQRSHYLPDLLAQLPSNGGSAEHPSIEDDPDGQDPDHLKTFTGVLVAIGLSVPIWLTITGLLYYLI